MRGAFRKYLSLVDQYVDNMTITEATIIFLTVFSWVITLGIFIVGAVVSVIGNVVKIEEATSSIHAWMGLPIVVSAMASVILTMWCFTNLSDNHDKIKEEIEEKSEKNKYDRFKF